MNYAVIMAGGSGTRFWPLSRTSTPKQFLSIVDETTMIQSTVERLKPVFKSENILIVGSQIHSDILKKLLPDFSADQFILEPFGRNTAAAVGLAAKVLQKRDKDAVLLVVPSDHIIKNTNRFYEILKQGLSLANEDKALLTIGLKPTRPETGYGYIQIDEDSQVDGYPDAFHVKTFAEKPNIETAQRFIRSGDFMWNSGMFLWRADVVLSEIKTFLPDLYMELSNLEPFIDTPEFSHHLVEIYSRMPNISIDYGVMEKAELVYVLKADLGWSDVGSWDEVATLAENDSEGNKLEGHVINVNSKNSFVKSKEKLIALVGVEDLIVVETEDSILICKKGESQNVKFVVDQLKRGNFDSYL